MKKTEKLDRLMARIVMRRPTSRELRAKALRRDSELCNRAAWLMALPCIGLAWVPNLWLFAVTVYDIAEVINQRELYPFAFDHSKATHTLEPEVRVEAYRFGGVSVWVRAWYVERVFKHKVGFDGNEGWVYETAVYTRPVGANAAYGLTFEEVVARGGVEAIASTCYWWVLEHARQRDQLGTRFPLPGRGGIVASAEALTRT